MVIIKIRLPEEACFSAQRAAAALTEREGKEVTFTEVVRRRVAIGGAVMDFEMNPTDAGAAAKLLHGNATLAAVGAYEFLQSQTENAA